jgi:phosphoribosyl-AMP cyclohydrolase
MDLKDSKPDISMIDFKKSGGLIPAIIQDDETGEVLMVAYMDEEALRRTLTTGRTWFYSRSRNEYWCKGETSGNKQYVRRVFYDCDADAVLVRVKQIGPACHTGSRSCFYRELDAVVIEEGE